MKTCPNCAVEVEDSFDLCWNCMYSFPDKQVVEIEDYEPKGKTIKCLRCNTAMELAGNFKFHEGTQLGVLGNLFELFENRQSFDLYTCATCGKVEFFMPQK